MQHEKQNVGKVFCYSKKPPTKKYLMINDSPCIHVLLSVCYAFIKLCNYIGSTESRNYVILFFLQTASVQFMVLHFIFNCLWCTKNSIEFWWDLKCLQWDETKTKKKRIKTLNKNCSKVCHRNKFAIMNMVNVHIMWIFGLFD